MDQTAVKQQKLRVIVDITPLHLGVRLSGTRSGIFFTVKNLLRQLLIRPDLDLYFHLSRREPTWENDVRIVLEREFPEFADRILSREINQPKDWLSEFCHRQLQSIDEAKKRVGAGFPFLLQRVRHFLIYRLLRHFPLFRTRCSVKDACYLSLMLTPPETICRRIPPERRWLLLYDTLPLLRSEYAVNLTGWYGEMIRALSPEEHYFAISESTRRDFLRLCPILRPEQITVTLLAASEQFRPVTDAARFAQVREKYRIPPDRKMFFSHCSLSPHKNLERLLSAFAPFYRRHPEWILVFGGGDLTTAAGELRRKAQETGLPETACCFTGYVEDSDLPVLYSMAEAFFFVSLYEGFGLPPLEAMSCGCPCVVGNTSSLPEVTGDAALLVDPCNTAEIEQGFQRLSEDAALRSRLHTAGLAQAKHFSWSVCADRMISSMRRQMEAVHG